MNEDLVEVSHRLNEDSCLLRQPELNYCTSAPGMREKDELSNNLSQSRKNSAKRVKTANVRLIKNQS